MEKIVFPRHDEPEAEKKLRSAFEHLAEAISPRPPLETGGVYMGWFIHHPDFDSSILCFSNFSSMHDENADLVIEVFNQDSRRRRRRRFLFRNDGSVEVQKPRDKYHEKSEGPDSVPNRTIQGWPEAARYLCGYIAKVMREAASWEMEIAAAFETQAT